MFKNPFSFKGRIRRLEYGLSYLAYIFFMILIVLVDEAILGENSIDGLLVILYIPIFWFLLAQGTKRCHDRDNSGWYQLIPFYQLWMLFAPGDVGENTFGPDPKLEHHHTSSDVIDDELMRYND
ncbi:MAG: DUF805 domain-containing protein [Chitinophagales bacterium]